MFSFQIDIWRGVTEVGIPVDFRVSFQQLFSVQVHLEKHNIERFTMIEDLQVQIQSGYQILGFQLFIVTWGQRVT